MPQYIPLKITFDLETISTGKKIEAVYQKDKSNAVVKINFDKQSVHVIVLQRLEMFTDVIFVLRLKICFYLELDKVKESVSEASTSL